MLTSSDIEGPLGANAALFALITLALVARRAHVLEATVVSVVAWTVLLAFLSAAVPRPVRDLLADAR